MILIIAWYERFTTDCCSLWTITKVQCQLIAKISYSQSLFTCPKLIKILENGAKYVLNSHTRKHQNIFLNISWWLLLLVKSWKMKWTMIPVLIFIINFSKWNRMLKKQKLTFLKKWKNMSTKQETVSDAAFKACPFSSDFNFVWKDDLYYKYYCPLIVNPTVTICCKEFHHVTEFLDPSLKTLPCTKTSPGSHENRSFYYFEMLPPLSEVIVFSL